jgi:hypothetical protein
MEKYAMWIRFERKREKTQVTEIVSRPGKISENVAATENYTSTAVQRTVCSGRVQAEPWQERAHGVAARNAWPTGGRVARRAMARRGRRNAWGEHPRTTPDTRAAVSDP